MRTLARLVALHAKEGETVSELASFTCPRCGERPIVFVGNGPPVVECLCLAPFSPTPEYADVELWDIPLLQNADTWGMFVAWKLSLPSLDEEPQGD